MADERLHERLRRLRHTPPPEEPRASGPVDAPETLTRLEQALLGGAAEDLPLKARLERLVAAASTNARGRRESNGPRLDELVAGREVENEHGRFFLIEEERPLDHWHGEMPLARLLSSAPQSVAILTGDGELTGFAPSEAVFLDTETTGLAGGSGTAAFLVGLGFVAGGRFRLRQYFMRDYDEEAALLAALASDLADFSRVVTFNGKMFDLPLLESRYRLNRQRFPLAATDHLDLLHPARRLWKARLLSCRLVVLESALLRIERSGDVPGEEIPQAYFDFIRSGAARVMARVFEHNRQDILSLATLTALACQWVEEGGAQDPRDIFSLGRVFERAELYERSEAEYRRAIAAAEGPASSEWGRAARLRLAGRLKREGRLQAAVDLWETAAAGGDLWALRELAMFLEHRQRALRQALELVEQGLRQLSAQPASQLARLEEDLLRRQARLMRKLTAR